LAEFALAKQRVVELEGMEGCVRCARASDPFYQWRDEKCHQHEGVGAGVGGAARWASECR
jgi:hypothetical protein